MLYVKEGGFRLSLHGMVALVLPHQEAVAWAGLACWKMQQLLCSSTKFKQFFLRIVHTSNLLQEIHQYLVKVMMIKSGSSGGVVNSLIVCY